MTTRQRLRLRFWCLALDAANAIDDHPLRPRALRPLSSRLYLWTVRKLADVVDWGPITAQGRDEPW